MLILTAEEIAAALNTSHVESLRLTWDGLQAAFLKHDCFSELVAVAALGTVRVEVGQAMMPIHERGGEEYFRDMYDVTGSHFERSQRLGNVEPGDGALFHGRGFIQLTGRTNYTHFGQVVGVDLVANPDRALDPVIAAEIFVVYFKSKGCVDAANAEEWTRVRHLVNGGDNQLPEFLAFVGRLREAIGRKRGD
jgi:hypothetical protein